MSLSNPYKPNTKAWRDRNVAQAKERAMAEMKIGSLEHLRAIKQNFIDGDNQIYFQQEYEIELYTGPANE